ncbi:hypothetical protein Angca_008126, partial [Angiostrongylus cantonensis]
MNSPYATIVDNPDFHPAMTAEKIDRALRAGDKDAIVKLITSISNNQRQLLREPYRIKYGKDIITALDKKFSGDLEKTIFALMDTPLDYDVKQLKQAMKGLGTDEAVLIEILCSRTPEQMKAIRIAYEKEYKKPLEQVVRAPAQSPFFGVLLVAFPSSLEVSLAEVCLRSSTTGSGRPCGSRNESYIRPFRVSELILIHFKVFAEFAQVSGASIEKAIEKEFSGDLQKSYLTIVRAASDKQKFFAMQLYNSMKGLGTRDNDLIRVLVTRSEVDLDLIKQDFQTLYNKSLEEMIKGDTSGQYRDALLAIVMGNR